MNAVHTISDGLLFKKFLKRGINVDSPKPTKIQNIALAMLPVIAISPKPFLVIAALALVSSQLLPQDNKVRPNQVALTPS